jgi:dienelactone hydrolase
MMGTRASCLDEQQPLEGNLATPDSARDLPGVLVVPSCLNVNESICRRADRLADLGYAAFVADLFGSGVRPAPPESPMKVVGPILNDRLRFRRRLSAGLRAFQERPQCNADHVAAMGSCIGGCVVLELVRAGDPLRGVVPLHGILSTPMAVQPKTVVSKMMTAVRRITQRSRTRCRDCRSSWSSVLIGTKRIVGRETASAIASASM